MLIQRRNGRALTHSSTSPRDKMNQMPSVKIGEFKLVHILGEKKMVKPWRERLTFFFFFFCQKALVITKKAIVNMSFLVIDEVPVWANQSQICHLFKAVIVAPPLADQSNFENVKMTW